MRSEGNEERLGAYSGDAGFTGQRRPAPEWVRGVTFALKSRLDEVDQGALGLGAGDRVDRLTALEDGQRGHRHHPVGAGGLGVLVDVDADDLDLVAHLLGDL